MMDEEQHVENVAIVFDYTLYKLRDMIEYENDPVEREVLLSFLELYSMGVVEIEWIEGLPFADFICN